jgi:hypothetical protein
MLKNAVFGDVTACGYGILYSHSQENLKFNTPKYC